MIHLFPTRAVALSLGPLSIHWYGIMYAVAFLLGILMFPKLLRRAHIDMLAKDRETFVLWVFFGVLLGGRLGFVLFYGGSYFLDHPSKIFTVWEGGMSSHGGFIGVCIALLIFTIRKNIDFFRLADILVIPVAIGLALGRLGNLINGELYGTVTTLPWGMQFPSVEGVRHPTQIYAVLKDLFIATVCFLHLSRNADKSIPPGCTAGLFLVLYGILRFTIEFFRDQPYGFTKIVGFDLSRGQLLTLPIIAAGIGIIFLRRQCKKVSEATADASYDPK